MVMTPLENSGLAHGVSSARRIPASRPTSGAILATVRIRWELLAGPASGIHP
ncbi:hypothetical protein D9M72_634470 [compost metagenome]